MLFLPISLKIPELKGYVMQCSFITSLVSSKSQESYTPLADILFWQSLHKKGKALGSQTKEDTLEKGRGLQQRCQESWCLDTKESHIYFNEVIIHLLTQPTRPNFKLS